MVSINRFEIDHRLGPHLVGVSGTGSSIASWCWTAVAGPVGEGDRGRPGDHSGNYRAAEGSRPRCAFKRLGRRPESNRFADRRRQGSTRANDSARSRSPGEGADVGSELS